MGLPRLSRSAFPVGASRRTQPAIPARNLPARDSQSLADHGFTFIEVLFAVILLGIGFIMIAAVFPVAIQQTSAVSNETQGTAITQDAIKKIQAVADAPGASALFPPTGTSSAPQVWAVTVNSASSTPNGTSLETAANNTGLLAALGSDTYSSADHRLGWVAFYRRDAYAAPVTATSPATPFAGIYLIALQNPNFPNYLFPAPSASATTVSSPMPPPVPPCSYGYAPCAGPYSATNAIQAQVYYNADFTTSVVLTYPSSYPSMNATTGAYMLISSVTTGSPNFVGRFFRLGVPSNGLNITGFTPPSGQAYQIFQLQPGYDLSPGDLSANSITPGTMPLQGTCFVIGAAPTLNSPPANSSDYTGPFTGPNQDVGVATAFIKINTANN